MRREKMLVLFWDDVTPIQRFFYAEKICGDSCAQTAFECLSVFCFVKLGVHSWQKYANGRKLPALSGSQNKVRCKGLRRFILFPFVFLPTFSVVMVVNQLSYGGCFEGYCIEAALPRVLFMAAIIAAVIVLNTSDKKRGPQESSFRQDGSQPKTSVSTNTPSHSKVRTNDQAHRKRAIIKNTESGDACTRLEFGRFGDAARASKILAKTHRIPIKQLRRGSKYYIEIPAGLKSVNIDSLLPDYDDESLTDLDSYNFAESDCSDEFQEFEYFDYQEAAEELSFEFVDDADAYARSNEDGWFYSDIDPGWENNVPDRDGDGKHS